MIILRGTARVLAAAAGLLLAYGMIFALEGMTTRIPVVAVGELATVTLWTTPWMLFFCSGMEDLATFIRKDYVLWLGAVVALVFLYYFDWHTTMSSLTKAAMPPLAVGAGLTPHFVRRLRFMFDLASIAAGITGCYVLYMTMNSFLVPTSHFATKLIGALFVTFILGGVVSGLLSLLDVYHRLTHRSYA